MAVTAALESVTTAHGTRVLLDAVTLGLSGGDRVGIVGRNGSGKTTLLRVLAGFGPVDSGRVVHTSGLRVALLDQADTLDPAATLGDVVVGSGPAHEWAGDARVRAVLDAFVGGTSAAAYPQGFATPVATMSGGERRRAALAGLLIAEPDLLLLDEPTNHLDVEAIAALAEVLAGWRGTVVFVTHDRWFLDAVATATWEVAAGSVHRYEGGYSAYVLARAERERVAAVTEARRNNLLRKELAWLRRGPPARTSKPQFRIDAANALIADEPPPRDRLALQKVATARLGRQVVDLEDVTLRAGSAASAGPTVLRDATWRLGPGDRVGLLGPNGAGKTTILRLLAGRRSAYEGTLRIGQTVSVAHLTQDLAEIDPSDRVLASLERVHANVEVTRGQTLTAQQLLEGFGFTGDRLFTRLGDLSGGERRRLQLLRLLLDGPNLLLLDEPTNDLDVETLTVLEDLLDTWPGTLVVVSHDRYFLERVCDGLYALTGDGDLRHLPGGVEDYLVLRRDAVAHVAAQPHGSASATVRHTEVATDGADVTPALSGAEVRAARKELQRLDRRLARITEQESRLHDDLAAAATDHQVVLELDTRLRTLAAERADLEEQWLVLAEELES